MAKIMFIVDHKWRDLPSSVYLKILLEKKYLHEVELVRLGEDIALMSSFKPHMVIYNNLYEADRNAYARHLKEQGVKIIILPTEGITFSNEQTLLFTHKYSGIEFIDAYLPWNLLMYNAILDNDVLPKSKLFLTGNPRFDFYRLPLSNLLKTREDFSHKYGIPGGNMNILITTNYANAEFWPDIGFLEKNLAKQRANGIPVFNNAAQLAKHEFDYRNKTFEFIREFVSRKDRVNILLKYHPSERKSLYRNFIETLRPLNKNIFLIEGEYIWDVLNISDLIMQRSSTVAIEAWLLNKPTVEMDLMPSTDHFLQPRYRDGSSNVKSVEQLLDVVESIECKGYSVKSEKARARENHLEKLLFNPDGRASIRIAETINSIAQSSSGHPRHVYNGNVKTRLKSIVRNTLGRQGYDVLANLIRLKLGDYLGRYNKKFSAEDIKEWETKLMPYCD